MLPPLPPGTILRNRYRIEGVIGGGGMALVYRVADLTAVGCFWALKELRATSGSLEEQEQARQQFRREADLLTHLSHPYLPKVADYFDEGGRSYLAMEFIQGHSLDKLLPAANGGLPEADVLTWMVQVSQVLAYLHQQQPPIIFRDLKPHNVMLTPARTIKLIDFGIARTYKVGKKKDTLPMGSENYAPPEQWGREQTDARADIYALGATMYHLLTNTPPPMSFLPDPLPQPRLINPLISPETEQVILKAMSKDRQARYPTARDLEMALGNCLARLKAASAPVPSPLAPSVPSPAPSPLAPSVLSPVLSPAPSGVPCPACGRATRLGARFCGRCGAPLGGPVSAMLEVLGPVGSAWQIVLSKTPFLIGRRSPADGVFPDLDLSFYDSQFISRRHAEISRMGNQFAVTDLASANRTFVNGTPLSPRVPRILHNGDRVLIGRVHLVFRLVG
jgi:serine/threonine protein kinase